MAYILLCELPSHLRSAQGWAEDGLFLQSVVGCAPRLHLRQGDQIHSIIWAILLFESVCVRAAKQTTIIGDIGHTGCDKFFSTSLYSFRWLRVFVIFDLSPWPRKIPSLRNFLTPYPWFILDRAFVYIIDRNVRHPPRERSFLYFVRCLIIH